VRINHRKEYVFSLGGQRGTSLFDYKKREIPLKTPLFFEQQKRFRAGLPAKEALYVLTFGIFLKENPIVRTLAIVFDFLTKVCKPKP
jgi:hypothetical protein